MLNVNSFLEKIGGSFSLIKKEKKNWFDSQIFFLLKIKKELKFILRDTEKYNFSLKKLARGASPLLIMTL